MAEQKHKARKNHICECCNESINVGEIYVHGKTRIPVFETDKIDAIYGYDGKQIGIKYIDWKICYKCLTELKEN